jgi:hypothetical protein
MKQQVIVLLIIFYFSSGLSAQQYFFEPAKKKDVFNINFIALLNDAPNKFNRYKGKLISRSDTIHLQSQIYQTKINLPGALACRYVQDSTFYVEFLMKYYSALDEATQGMQELTEKVASVLLKRVVILKHDYGANDNLFKENKICCAQHTGFFHSNISIQLTKVNSNNMYRLSVQLYSGKPFFYYWVAKNEPIGGFNFVNYVKNTFISYNKETNGCPVEIPTYTCLGNEIINDSILINYGKYGFEGLLDAKAQYDVTFGNLRAGLGKEYVYFFVPYTFPVIKRIAFVKFDEIDLHKRKTLLLSLIEKNSNAAVLQNPYKKNYMIRLSFIY